MTGNETERELILRVLLAEDSPLARREIARELQAVPGVAEVVAVGSIGETRRALEDDTFDACVLDFHLGDGTALDILRDRAKFSRARESVFIVLTASPSAVLSRRCLASGADHFFAKPDEMQQLVELLATLPAEGSTAPPA